MEKILKENLILILEFIAVVITVFNFSIIVKLIIGLAILIFHICRNGIN